MPSLGVRSPWLSRGQFSRDPFNFLIVSFKSINHAKSKFETPSMYKLCPLIDLIENALLEIRFMVSIFTRRISGYIICQMYYEIATYIVESNKWIHIRCGKLGPNQIKSAPI